MATVTVTVTGEALHLFGSSRETGKLADKAQYCTVAHEAPRAWKDKRYVCTVRIYVLYMYRICTVADDEP